MVLKKEGIEYCQNQQRSDALLEQIWLGIATKKKIETRMNEDQRIKIEKPNIMEIEQKRIGDVEHDDGKDEEAENGGATEELERKRTDAEEAKAYDLNSNSSEEMVNNEARDDERWLMTIMRMMKEKKPTYSEKDPASCV